MQFDFLRVLVFGLIWSCFAAVVSASPMGQSCDVVWDSPSADWRGSMPLGNGDIGLNVWVEPSGDLIFYISKTDAWDEIMRLVKVGRVRVQFSPKSLTPGYYSFQQALRLEDGMVTISGGPTGGQIRLRVWVDANHPVIRVEAEGDTPFTMKAALEVWRDRDRVLDDSEFWGAYAVPNAHGMGNPPEQFVTVVGDVVVDRRADQRLLWYHRNTRSIWREVLTMQGLGDLAATRKDPLLNQTFGGTIWGEGLVAATTSTLQSAQPAPLQSLSIALLTQQTDTPEQYLAALEQQAAALRTENIEAARAAHRAWWSAFWDRSWILVSKEEQRDAFSEVDLARNPLRFGINSELSGYNLFGDLARVRISKGALPPDQIAAAAAWRGESAPPAPGVIGDWIFDEPVEGVYPNRANPATPARLVGEGAPAERDGVRALRFAGKGYLEVAHDPSLMPGADCTLEAWVAPEAMQVGCQLIGNTFGGNPYGYLLGMTGAPGAWTQFGRWTLSGGTTEIGKWAHVATTIDLSANKQKLYLNGALVGETDLGLHSDVSRGYALQRFITACAGRGARPIKFNGTIFNMGPDGNGADFRMWGGPYWQQNTRLVYWPMAAAGDYEMLDPWFRMFLDTLPEAEARTRYFYDQGGAYFPEVMWWFGTLTHTDYGWKRPEHLTKEVVLSPATFRHFTGNTELLAIMLERYRHQPDPAFLRDQLIPLAQPILQFFEEQFPLDPATGLMKLHNAQGLETYYGQVNPANEVAGLQCVLDGLLELPDGAYAPELRSRWQAMRAAVPPLALCEHKGKPVIAISETLCQNQGYEIPELYPVFPFRRFGVGLPDLERARNTYANTAAGALHGWNQQGIMAAHLGLAAEARRHLVWRFAMSNPEMRFPAFWGPNYDWTPDQDHGAVGQKIFQSMLLQEVGQRILLFPAWPADWDVDFKLHAAQNTTISGKLRNGALSDLKVTPLEREADVEVILNQQFK